MLALPLEVYDIASHELLNHRGSHAINSNNFRELLNGVFLFFYFF